MNQPSYESRLGYITLNIPYATREDLLLANTGLTGKNGKVIIEDDFSGKNEDFPTNDSIRDYLEYDVNAEHNTLYLDSSVEHLKVFSNSQLAILRAAVELNNIQGYNLSASEVEEFRTANKIFSTKQYGKFEEVDEDEEFIRLMGGMLDFYAYFKENDLTYFQVSGNLLDLYSDYPEYSDVEEVLSYRLYSSPSYSEIEFESESGCFFANAKTPEALVELISTMNELAGLLYTKEDKENLLSTINLVITKKKLK